MKTHAGGAVCAAILCLAAVGFAQQPTNQSQMNQNQMNQGTTVSGSIVSVNNDVIVIRTDAGETMRFNRDASANVPTNLMAGNRVSIGYNRLAADNFQLTRISLDDGADTRGTTPGSTNPTTTQHSTTPGATTPGTTTYGSADRTATGYDRLPRTASPLVMVAFVGLVSLGGALALRARRRS